MSTSDDSSFCKMMLEFVAESLCLKTCQLVNVRHLCLWGYAEVQLGREYELNNTMLHFVVV